MDPKILFLGPSKRICDFARSIADEYSISMHVSHSGVLINNELDVNINDFSVIVALPGLAYMVKQPFAGVIITIKIPSCNIIEALLNAKHLGNDIVVLIDKDTQYELKKIIQHIEVLSSVNIGYYDHSKLSLKDHHVLVGKVLVGTGSSAEFFAREYNLPFVPIRVEYADILEGVLTGRNILLLMRQLQEANTRRDRLAELSRMGVVTFNAQGMCLTINHEAKSIFGIAFGESVENLQSRRTANALQKMYEDGSETDAKVLNFSGHNLIVQRRRRRLDQQQTEVVVFLQRFSDIQHAIVNLRETERQAHNFNAQWCFEDIACASESFRKCIEKARRFSHADAALLIEGETGSGKEVLAQSVHNESPRSKYPFVAMNCATFSRELLESELFGYEEGAFTGAKRGGKIGLLELAKGGTIFLDEISETPLEIQARLLRVLQERKLMHLGGDKLIDIDVRVITACNKPLLSLVLQGFFRADLYYRLNQLRLVVPPLREREEDIPALVQDRLERIMRRSPINIQRFDKTSLALLCASPWPGNVRELENLVEKVCILANDEKDMPALVRECLEENDEARRIAENIITPPSPIPARRHSDLQVPVGSMKQMRDFIMEEMMRRHEGNQQAAANALQVSRTTIWNALQNKQSKRNNASAASNAHDS